MTNHEMTIPNPEQAFIDKETEKAIAHIEKETVPLHPDSPTKCVDGGYQNTEATGAPARAGGDMGYVEAAITQPVKAITGWNAEQTFSKIYDFVTIHKKRKFGWHSDTHSQVGNEESHGHDGGSVIGCGHCQKALDNPQEYELDQADLRNVIELAKTASESELIILKRKHAEQGVMVIQSESQTVNAWSYEGQKETEDVAPGESQYFIYNVLQDHTFVKELVAYFLETGDLTSESAVEFSTAFTQALDKHTDITLSKLAVNKTDGSMLPVFLVQPEKNGVERVKFLQRALSQDQVKAKWATL